MKFALISVLSFVVLFALAAPEVVHHCGNGVDACPPGNGWTCCGPLIEGIGGTCRKLKPGEVCAF